MYFATKLISQLLAGFLPCLHNLFVLFLKKGAKGENITFQDAVTFWEYTIIMRNNNMKGNFFMTIPVKSL